MKKAKTYNPIYIGGYAVRFFNVGYAHEKLDYEVLDAYGWPHDISDEEILERLLALNLERAKKQEKD